MHGPNIGPRAVTSNLFAMGEKSKEKKSLNVLTTEDVREIFDSERYQELQPMEF